MQLPNVDTFEEFNTILAKHLANINLSSVHIGYRRPRDVTEFESWMKSQLDKFLIDKIDYNYQEGELTYSSITHSVESALCMIDKQR